MKIYESNNERMLVSVIMSVRNAQKTLEKSINSILDQTYDNYEFLILDDYSTDNTLETLNKFKNRKNIKIFKNDKNLGLTKSLNILIELSSGTLIARQDSDDYSHKERIEKQVKKLKNDNLDFVSCRAKIISSSKVIPSVSYYLPKKTIIRYKNPFIHGTLLIKKEELLKAGGYNENFYYAQDYKLMTDLISENKRFKIIKEPLYFLNMKGNISEIYKKEQKYYSDCVKKGLNPINE